MTPKTTIFAVFVLAMIGSMTGAAPARAFCIDNKSPYTLRIHLETPNPYGKFRVLFKPGNKSCCSWFTQRCNPTRTRDGLLMFSVRTKANAKIQRFCVSGWVKQILATADGSITITDHQGSLGGLKCDSRDFFKRPVTQQTFLKRKRNGLPPAIVVPRRPNG